MDLIAGQVIELVIPSALAGGDDVDLDLYNSKLRSRRLVEGVEGQVEQVTVPPTPADGTYFVRRFRLLRRAAMYRLSVGQSTVTSNVAGTAPQR